MSEENGKQRRVVLVTGAARGQGLAIVTRLVADGYAVVAGDVLEEDLLKATTGFSEDEVLPLVLDITSQQSWQDAVAATRERFGGLDCLVNNAGIMNRALIEDEDPAAFERNWRVNCYGPFLGIQACLPLLKASKNAAIVNTVSSAGVRPFVKHVSYTTSKFGTRGLSLSAAFELAEYGIRVNSVLPGPIATPMHDEENISRLAEAPLLGRAGEAKEIAAAVAFLLSDESSFTVGAELLVDGGHLLRM
jgi:NAD(P)-dependent dehydrogenase (short-subunit alcohol dehydrogenase family)